MLYPIVKKEMTRSFPFQSRESVVVAVSGGIDSMVLLHLLHRISMQEKWKLTVAHVNYQLRGEASDRDAAFVVERAESMGLRCFVRLFGEGSHGGNPRGGNLQNEMRSFRYRFFQELAEEFQASALVTGHHRGDQAESILLHLLRGTGLNGLTGMSLSEEREGRQLIRPLLSVSRQEIEAYAHHFQVLFQHDESNDAFHYTRNRIRHQLLPLLKEFNPQIEESLTAMGERLAHDKHLLDLMTNQALEEIMLSDETGRCVMARRQFLELPHSLRTRLLSKAFERFAHGEAHLNADHLKRMNEIALREDASQGEYALPSPFLFRRLHDKMVFERVST